MQGQCANCDHRRRAPATRRLWCPTWVYAHSGPKDLCDLHARTFQPEHNPNASNGSWHWDDEADAAFTSVELFIPRTDERYANARGMIVNGSRMSTLRSTLATKECGVYVVDGKAWLLTREHATRLGDIREARDRFPALFSRV